MDAVALACFFFFQAEDGIRDLTVTGVQTCALPIFDATRYPVPSATRSSTTGGPCSRKSAFRARKAAIASDVPRSRTNVTRAASTRSEERRVGKEGRSRWSPYH